MVLMDVGNQWVLQALKFYLPPGTRLTSVYRPAQAQLNIIVQKARKEGFVFARQPTLAVKSSWVEALQYLRKRGYKIAEPGISRHQSALAYDLSGPDLPKIEAAVRQAVADKRIRLVHGARHPILIEKVNKCVHVEIEGAVLDAEPFDFA